MEGELASAPGQPCLLLPGVGSPAAISLFGRGGLLNANQYLRIGVGPYKGSAWFRLAGKVIEFFKPVERHHRLYRIGPWTGGPWG